ncbi:DUF6894 family protein [Sphingomonas sp. TDK1]|uniref:DUF6894 family protein n=1 Tax=Sphingomonas sp. TDK1 TaxID=453247 RepID=UPI0007D93DBF|nr:hypothetical protein A7X12_22010 [Sphingomonas sp. TDK1]
MPAYCFQLRTPDHHPHAAERRELPDLRHALIAGHHFARNLLRGHAGPKQIRGSLDIEDESNQPVARILLADLVRQLS